IAEGDPHQPPDCLRRVEPVPDPPLGLSQQEGGRGPELEGKDGDLLAVVVGAGEALLRGTSLAARAQAGDFEAHRDSRRAIRGEGEGALRSVEAPAEDLHTVAAHQVTVAAATLL